MRRARLEVEARATAAGGKLSTSPWEAEPKLHREAQAEGGEAPGEPHGYVLGGL